MPGRPLTKAKNATLISRAGAGAVQVLADLDRALGPGGPLSVDKYVAKIEELVNATRETKSGTQPDDRARCLGMQLWERAQLTGIAYGIGTPLQRIHTTEEKVGMSPEERLDQFRESPALFLAAEKEFRSIRKTLEAEGVIEPEIEA